MVDESTAPSANLKQIARSIFANALADCSIDQAFDRILHTSSDANGTRLLLDGEEILALDRLKRVRIISIGKAAPAMLTSLLARLPLPPSCDLQGVLIAAEAAPNLPATIQIFPGGHPVPNHASFAGASAALAMLHAIADAPADETLCIFLISGGGSSIMELPLDRAISLEEAIAFHRALVHCGASIVEINCVRKHFSAVKGGRLALAAGRVQKISMLVSDVPPAHLDALASGPTVADPTTVAECREVIARYKLLDQFPPSVQTFFTSCDLPESPKPGELISPCWKLLDSDELARAAQRYAQKLGFHAIIDNTCDDWNYADAADYLLDRLSQLRREHLRVCLISAGEVTVQLPHGRPCGIGGRNQHFVLYAATRLRSDDDPIVILSAGSDGIDGNSPAAGAVIDQHAHATPRQLASAHQALDQFDSFTWLNQMGATIVTGPTGHNLRDLRVLLAN